VTLRFLGEVPDERLIEVQQWLLASLESARGGILRLGQPGFFDQRGRYVLWVGLEQAEWIAELAAKLQGVVAGVLPERREFAAHLTVARVEVTRGEEESFSDFLKQFTASHLPPAAELATEVVLYRSELAVKGAPYSVMATAKLG
jgi:2'-5' RNA ligase